MAYSLITSRKYLEVIIVTALTACASNKHTIEERMIGSIDYPFVGSSSPLGTAKEPDRLVIRSTIGGQQYEIEIPGDDFDVEIPIGREEEKKLKNKDQMKLKASTRRSDKELLSALPKPSATHKRKQSLVDKAFGVTDSSSHPKNVPSYILGTAKIKDHYRKHEYEYALISLNELLQHYPNSPKLHKMKGSLLIRLGNKKLAINSWKKALELEPRDKILKQALARIQD